MVNYIKSYFSKYFAEFIISKSPTTFFYFLFLFFQLRFTSCKAEQPLQDMELQEKGAQKD